MVNSKSQSAATSIESIKDIREEERENLCRIERLKERLKRKLIKEMRSEFFLLLCFSLRPINSYGVHFGSPGHVHCGHCTI